MKPLMCSHAGVVSQQECPYCNSDKKKALELLTAKCRQWDAEEELSSATDLANMWAREMGVEEASDIYGLRLLVDRLWTASSLRMAELALQMEAK